MMMCDEKKVSYDDDDVSCGKDEILEELKCCLPKWVTQEQVTDMIRGYTKTNIVEIVDDFYEHETKFYEQVPDAVSSFASRDGIGSKLEFISSETKGNDSSSCGVSSSQLRKLKGMSISQKSSVSPVKRKQKMKGKAKKKGIGSSSKAESVGPKQASITKFFNKVTSK
ncbi:unnamed protein product [Cochlearia groenlandica]